MDNACVESFFHSMKVEAIQYELIMTRDEMRQTVFEYIEIDYNRTRRHSALEHLCQLTLNSNISFYEVSSLAGAEQFQKKPSF